MRVPRSSAHLPWRARGAHARGCSATSAVRTRPNYRCGADATSAPEMVACNRVAIGTRSHTDAAETFRSPGPQPVYTSPELVRVAILVGGKHCVWRRSPRNPHSHGLYGSVVGLYQEWRIASDPPSAPLCKLPPPACTVNKNIVSARSRTPFPSPLRLPRFGNALGVG